MLVEKESITDSSAKFGHGFPENRRRSNRRFQLSRQDPSCQGQALLPLQIRAAGIGVIYGQPGILPMPFAGTPPGFACSHRLNNRQTG